MSAPLAVDFETPIENGISTFMEFVPKLVGFLVILVVGYIIAKVVQKIINAVLEKVGFDKAVERGGVKKAMEKSSYDASDIVAKLAFYFIFVAALSMAFSTLGIQALEQPMAQLLALLPKILVALVIVVIGAAIAAAAKKFISNVLGGLSYGNGVAIAVSALIMVLFAKAALDTVGIATNVTDAVLYTALAIIAGVSIVGIGGGLIKPMQGRWESMLNKADLEKENVKAEAKKSKGEQSSSQPYPADSTTASTTTKPVATTTTYGTQR
jgi:hypothetical protein